MSESHENRAPTAAELKALIEAERDAVPFVHWRDETDTQRIMKLDDVARRWTIGRRAQSDIPLTWDPEVSRGHALLERAGEEWTLVDDGLSRNGSFVNGSRVQGRHRLHNRDSMCFGNTRVIYHEPVDPEGGASTARALDAPSSVRLTETQRRVLIALCRPRAEGTSTTPATNPQIANEVFLSVDAVKAHLRVLFERFHLEKLAQNEKRQRLVSIVLDQGVLTRRDF